MNSASTPPSESPTLSGSRTKVQFPELEEGVNNNPNLIKCLKNLSFLSEIDLQPEDQIKALISLKSRTKLLREENPELLKYLQREEIVLMMRDWLISKDKNVRLNTVRILKVLLDSNSIQLYRQCKL